MTHTFPVEINVANTDQKLRPGMFARATLNLGTMNHVVVPDLAIEKRSGSGDRFVRREQTTLSITLPVR